MKSKRLCAIMHPQAEISPKLKKRIHMNVPRFRTTHIPKILNFKGATVSPTP